MCSFSFAFWRWGGKIPGLKPIPIRGAFYAELKPACGRQVQLPLLKQGAPTEKRLQVIPEGPHDEEWVVVATDAAGHGCESVRGSGRIWAILMKVT